MLALYIRDYLPMPLQLLLFCGIFGKVPSFNWTLWTKSVMQAPNEVIFICNLSNAEATFDQSTRMQKSLNSILTLSYCYYSSESYR